MENGVDQDVIVDGVKNVRINSSGKLLQNSIFCMIFLQYWMKLFWKTNFYFLRKKTEWVGCSSWSSYDIQKYVEYSFVEIFYCFFLPKTDILWGKLPKIWEMPYFEVWSLQNYNI